jgi:hypothetical protein
MATIAQAWAKREAALKTLRIAWHQGDSSLGVTAAIRALNSSRVVMDRRRGGKTPPASVPGPSMVSLKTQSAVCVDGERFAYISDTAGTEQINGPQSRFRLPSHVHLAATRAKVEKYCDYRSTAGAPDPVHATFSSRRPEDSFELRLPDIQPLILALRPLATHLSFIDLSKYKVSPVRGMIGEQICVIIEPIDQPGKDKPGESRQFYWLDPARDYVIARAVVETKGRCSRRIDIAYEHIDAGWVPSGWSVLTLSQKGHMDQARRSTRAALSIGNPLPAAMFTIEKPLKTPASVASEVSDRRQLARTGARAAASQRVGRVWFVVASNALLGVVLTGLYTVRKYKRASGMMDSL